MDQQPAKNRQGKSGTAIVTRFELVNYLTSKSFRVATIITCLLILLSLSFPRLAAIFRSRDGEKIKGTIYLVNRTEIALDEESLQAALPRYELKKHDLAKEEDPFDLLGDKITGVFLLEDQNNFAWYTERIAFNEYPEQILRSAISSQVSFALLQDKGIPEEEAMGLIQGAQLHVHELAEMGGKSQEQTQLYTYFLVLILYIAIMMYGQMTAVSVASEKGSRAMELLVTSTKPRYLINGKVLGTGLAGLIQLLIFGLFYFLVYSLNKSSYSEGSVFALALKMPPDVFLVAILSFVLCYLAFAFIFAALGSLVSRSEEVSQVITPVTMAFIVIFMVAIFATFTPEKTWVGLLVFVPFAGPLILFVRYSMIGMGPLPFAIALVIHVLTVALCSSLATKVYRAGVLRYGQSARFTEFFKILRPAKEKRK